MSCCSCFSAYPKQSFEAQVPRLSSIHEQSSQEKETLRSVVDKWVSVNRCVDVCIGPNFLASYHKGLCLSQGDPPHPSHWNRKVVMNLHLEEDECCVAEKIAGYFWRAYKVPACCCGNRWTDSVVDSLEIQRHYFRFNREENSVVKRFVD